MNNEVEANTTPQARLLADAEQQLMSPPARPSMYTVVPQALRAGVLTRGDVAAASAAAHRAGLSNSDFQALQIAATSGKAESADGRPADMRRARMLDALKSRHGQGAQDQVTKATSVMDQLRASPALASMVDYAMHNAAFIQRMATRSDYIQRRKGG